MSSAPLASAARLLGLTSFVTPRSDPSTACAAPEPRESSGLQPRYCRLSHGVARAAVVAGRRGSGVRVRLCAGTLLEHDPQDEAVLIEAS